MRENTTKTERQRAEKLFNFRPVFFSAVFLCLGIVFYFYYKFYGVSALWLLSLIPIAATPFFFCRTKEKLFRTALAVSILGVCFFVGLFSFSLQYARFFDGDHLEGEGYVAGRVVEKREYEDHTALVLDDILIGEERVHGNLVAYLPASFGKTVKLSDTLVAYGEIEAIEVDGESFGLAARDFGDEIRFKTWSDEAIVTGNEFDLFLFLRARAETVIAEGMDETPATVMRAALFGDTDAIDEALYENIRRGGIAHIFAVSGLHVGALFGFCLMLLKKTPLRRLPKALQFVLLTGLLFLYAGICGFSASVVRASIICLIAYAATLLGVKTDLTESLGAAAICILLITPSALFEVGFQLSFAACFGIAFLSKPIGQVFDEMAKLWSRLFPRKPTEAEIEAAENDDTMPPGLCARIWRSASSFLSASLGAQIFTSPLLLYYFGYISGWALLLNCIFVPFISAVFSLLLSLVFAACLLPVEFAAIVLYVPNVIWSGVLLAFQTMDFSTFAVSGLKISVPACIVYFAGCSFLSDKWNIAKPLRYGLAVLCLLSLVAIAFVLNI